MDPTTRRVILPGGRHVVVTDTVGFIHKLPPMIATAFRATLEEIGEAAVIVHVVDGAAANAAEQCQTVENILRELGLATRPRITAVNKVDCLLDTSHRWDEASALAYLRTAPASDPDTVLISAQERWGLVGLATVIARMLTSEKAR